MATIQYPEGSFCDPANPVLVLNLHSFVGVRSIVRGLGLTITQYAGEYRVNFSGGVEATAYYSNDLCDALGTARDMAARRDAEWLRQTRITPPSQSLRDQGA